jgi:acetyl esterase/lipase
MNTEICCPATVFRGSALAYAGDLDLKTPVLSPLFGSFADFPPTLIVVGTHDCLLDDSRNVSTRMRAPA